MLEIGAVKFNLHHRPLVLLHRGDPAGGKPTLPADLQGHIYIEYRKAGPPSLADYLETEIGRNADIRKILDDPARDRFLSARWIESKCTVFNLPKETWRALAEKFPTAGAWRSLTADAIGPVLQANRFLAGAIVEAVKAALE